LFLRYCQKWWSSRKTINRLLILSLKFETSCHWGRRNSKNVFLLIGQLLIGELLTRFNEVLCFFITLLVVIRCIYFEALRQEIIDTFNKYLKLDELIENFGLSWIFVTSIKINFFIALTVSPQRMVGVLPLIFGLWKTCFTTVLEGQNDAK